ncbi:hypothetical protein HH1059_11010 [Halorhodospira halochloris]|uniref:Uncharacterized protein n=1 Tax=Halorhodospira halochloris TaxID=1052 RepID=A0A0X8X995_HALHR|nr:hypothetical protein [Halorhodospira halochloris]MBK1652395.1 hypothetical protein [Halorhodospira halochloris]BAU57800.1 hypothetical protein HH1059_11010 [Halorhodospira halochloris]
MDPIQKGIAELERQRKAVRFNYCVFAAALRESSEHFQCVREADYGRVASLDRVLRIALAEQSGEARCPPYWSKRAEAHATSVAVYSKFYAAMMGVFGLGTAYFLGDSNWALTVTLGLLLAVLTKAKWGVDKYAAGLQRVRDALERIEDSPKPDTLERPSVERPTKA